jgi:hypothetical protein
MDIRSASTVADRPATEMELVIGAGANIAGHARDLHHRLKVVLERLVGPLPEASGDRPSAVCDAIGHLQSLRRDQSRMECTLSEIGDLIQTAERII